MPSAKFENRIGLIGVGRLGEAMAARLVDTHREVIAWNRTPKKVADVQMVKTMREVVESCDVILTSLTDGAAVRAVYLDTGGLATQALNGKLFIETSTIAPQVSKIVGDAVRGQGGAFVDCPLLGTVTPARNGELLAMLGGPEADVKKAMQAMEPLARGAFHMGGAGAGSATKLAVTLVMGSYWAALGDALALADKFGIDQYVMTDILKAGPAGLASLPAKLPILQGEQRPVEFNLNGFVEILHVTLEAAGDDTEMPVAEAVLKSYSEAVSLGSGEKDVVVVALRGSPSLRH